MNPKRLIVIGDLPVLFITAVELFWSKNKPSGMNQRMLSQHDEQYQERVDFFFQENTLKLLYEMPDQGLYLLPFFFGLQI